MLRIYIFISTLISGTSAVVLITFASMFVSSRISTIQPEILGSAEQASHYLLYISSYSILTEDETGLKNLLSLALSEPHVHSVRIEINDPSSDLNKIYEKSRSEDIGNIFERIFESFLPLQVTIQYPITQPQITSESIVYDYEISSKSSSELGILTLTMSSKLVVKDVLNSLFRSLLYTISAAFIVTLLAVYIAVRNLASPIKQLTELLSDVNAFKQPKTQFDFKIIELRLLYSGYERMSRNIARLIDTKDEEIQSATQELRSQNIALDIARREADLANRAKTTFLSSVSHELRTPLHGISGFADILRNTELNFTQREYLSDIIKSTEILESLISDVLEFSANGIDSQTPSEEWFDVVVEIDNQIKAILPECIAKSLYIDFVPDISSPYIYSDRHKIGHMVQHLLDNAVKFTHSGGVICKISLEYVKDKNPNAILSISILDTGIGLPQGSNSNHIFDVFEQYDSGSDREYSGTGIGLAIVKKYYEILNGNIEIENRQDIGASFTINIPVSSKWSMTDKQKEFIRNSPVSTQIQYLIPADIRQSLQDSLKCKLKYLGFSAQSIDTRAGIVAGNAREAILVPEDASISVNRYCGNRTVILINRNASIGDFSKGISDALLIQSETTVGSARLPGALSILSGLCILCVGDNLDVLELHRNLLTRMGAKVYITSTYKEFDSLFDLIRVDLVLLDLSVAHLGRSAVSLIQEIHERRKGTVFIVGLTEDAGISYSEDMAMVIQKPLTMSKLQQLCESLNS